MVDKVLLTPDNIKSFLSIYHVKDHKPVVNCSEMDLPELLLLLSSGLAILADVAQKLLRDNGIKEPKQESPIFLGGAICKRCRRPVQKCLCENPLKR